ncbi:MAG: ABC transporter ATP-binding protein [Bacillota bacterium]
MKEVISTTNLTKIYGETYAVNKLNLSVKQGEIFGFIGLNGAGKTTTIRMLLGLVKPTTGYCYLQGRRVNAGNTSIFRNVGYIVETPYSYPELTVRENLEIVRKLRGMEDRDSVNWIIKKLKLEGYTSKRAGHLSLGNAQRLGIAKAIIHRPKILILDEPTNGLDPEGIVEVRQLLMNLANNQGVTILVSSHKLEEISRLATNISIIHNGCIIKELDKKQLEGQLKKVLLVGGEERNNMKSILSEAGYRVVDEGIDFNDEIKPLQIQDDDAINSPEKIATLLVKAGHPPALLKVRQEDLESYFLRVLKEAGEV